MSADAIWEKLVAAVRAGQTRKIVKLADQFMNETLLGKEYPEDYFNLLLKIFSDSEVRKSKEIFNFLVNVMPDIDRLSKNQLDRLAETLLDNIENFGDDMSIHTAIDFMARFYPQKEVPILLSKLAAKNIQNKGVFLRLGAKIAVSNGKMDKEMAARFLNSINQT